MRGAGGRSEWSPGAGEAQSVHGTHSWGRDPEAEERRPVPIPGPVRGDVASSVPQWAWQACSGLGEPRRPQAGRHLPWGHWALALTGADGHFL